MKRESMYTMKPSDDRLFGNLEEFMVSIESSKAVARIKSGEVMMKVRVERL